jgi:hypothetical protein
MVMEMCEEKRASDVGEGHLFDFMRKEGPSPSDHSNPIFWGRKHLEGATEIIYNRSTWEIPPVPREK